MVHRLNTFLIVGFAAAGLAASGINLPWTPTAAVLAAGNGNGGDHGPGANDNDDRGNGGEHGNGGDHGNTDVASLNDNASGGNSGNAPGRNKVDGVNPSASVNAALGALNASNANLQAFLHANPKAEVGKLALYAEAVVAVEDAQAMVASATTAYNNSQALATYKAAHPGLSDYSLDGLMARYELLLMDPMANAQELDQLEALFSSPQAIALAEAEDDLAAAEATANTALQVAANKPVTAAVKASLDATLEEGGILDYYRTH